MERFLPRCHVKKYNVTKKFNKYLVVLLTTFPVTMLSAVLTRRNSTGSISNGFLYKKKCSSKNNKTIHPKTIKLFLTKTFYLKYLLSMSANLRKLCQIRISKSFKDYTH